MNDTSDQFSNPPLSPSPRAQSLLLDFLRDHDAPCPLCGYNLRALTRPICPECGQELHLTVGAARLRLGWLFAALAPCFFSGIAAVFTLIPIVGRLYFGDGKHSPGIYALSLIGFTSGIFAILLAKNRHRFLSQSRSAQRWWALGIWLTHIAALGLFLLSAYLFL